MYFNPKMVTEDFEIDITVGGRTYHLEASFTADSCTEEDNSGKWYSVAMELVSLRPIDQEEEDAMPTEGTPEEQAWNAEGRRLLAEMVKAAMLEVSQIYAQSDYPEEQNISIVQADNFKILPFEEDREGLKAQYLQRRKNMQRRIKEASNE